MGVGLRYAGRSATAPGRSTTSAAVAFASQGGNRDAARPVSTSTRAGSKQTMVGAAHVRLTALFQFCSQRLYDPRGTNSSITTPPIRFKGLYASDGLGCHGVASASLRQ